MAGPFVQKPGTFGVSPRASGGGGAVTPKVTQDYIELVLDDMGPTRGVFFPIQDAEFLTLTDIGPGDYSGMNGGIGAFEADGPWPGSKSVEDTTMQYSGSIFPLFYGFGAASSIDGFVRFNSVGGTRIIHNLFRGPDVILSIGNLAAFVLGQTEPNPPSWAGLTAYVQGDRVAPTGQINRIMECEIAGTSAVGEPTWPSVPPLKGTLTVDGTVTWNFVNFAGSFHTLSSGSSGEVFFNELAHNVPMIDTWYHYAVVREQPSGDWVAYLDGVESDRHTIDAPNTTVGTFGSPIPLNAAESFATGTVHLGHDGGGDDRLSGRLAFLAHYDSALSAAQVLEHYELAVDLGLNT